MGMSKGDKEFINLRIRVDTAESLKRLGKMGESYDDVIQRLLPKRLRRGEAVRKR